MTSIMAAARGWHVTTKSAADEILEEGFRGGWGDNGFGVYLFTDVWATLDYLTDGGWDGEADPSELCVIEVEFDHEEVRQIEIDPGWPDPESYEHVVYRPMDEDKNPAWKPVMRLTTGKEADDIAPSP